MANNTTNTLTAVITATDDVTQNVPINFGTGNPAYDSTSAEFIRWLALAMGVNAIAIPKVPTSQVYIKNLDTAKTINIGWNGNGGGMANFIILNPGDQIILWCNPATAGGGINALQMTPSAAGAFVEYFVGG